MNTPTGTWTEESVGGHPCDIYQPSHHHPHGFVVLYLHGVHLQQLHDKAPFMAAFDQHGLPVVAPRTQRSWWTDRICLEFDPQLTAERHVLDNVVPFIRDRWQLADSGIGLFGTSMGGQGALRLAYKHPQTFPVTAAISPAIDYQLRFDEGDETLPSMYRDAEQARQDTALLHIHPLNWPRHQFFCCDPSDYPWFDSAERLRMKLGSLGVPFESDLETTGGGHGFDYYNRMAEKTIGFLVSRLEKERLRVP
ncbi:MAG: esterase [Planctomycetaceae bacterium]|nr:esterase [Planctomycetaceae bacterium]